MFLLVHLWRLIKSLFEEPKEELGLSHGSWSCTLQGKILKETILLHTRDPVSRVWRHIQVHAEDEALGLGFSYEQRRAY